MSIAVIGLGTVGSRVLKEIKKSQGEEVIGTDIDKERVRKLKEFGAREKPDKACDTYIICVYTTKQVFDVLKTLDYSKKPLVSVESTIIPGSEKEMAKIVLNKGGYFVLCPHRLFISDPEYQIFNTNRLIAGADKESLQKGMDFYKRFMDEKLLTVTDIKHAAMSKILENSYRFLEISTAEELKMLFDSKGYDFDELKKCAETKWNINIKEARDGVRKGCLPKDIKIFNKIFPKNTLFNRAVDVDSKYKKKKR